MLSHERIVKVVSKYNLAELTIGTLGSHSALQILKGARDEGFRTLVVCRSDQTHVYQHFGLADEFVIVDNYKDLLSHEIQEQLLEHNVILIPHGSFVEYIGSENISNKLYVPLFGNRRVLEWESSRDKQRELLEMAGIKMPKKFDTPEEIDRLVMVKFPGAKGGKGYFLAKNKREFEQKLKKVKGEKKYYTIQEYVIGTLIYPHYFYSPILSRTELMSMDIRYESNIDGLTRIPERILKGYLVDPSYVVTGNIPLVARESLLPKIFEMGENVIKVSQKLFPPGMVGPFCLECICTPDLELWAFEISARIVAGTNLYVQGSPYSQLLWNEPMSTGRRIAREIKLALEKNRLLELIY